MGDEQVATLGIRLLLGDAHDHFCEMERYWKSAVVNGSFCMV